MDSDQQKLQSAIDLGLLTRVACHEINNLVASQQGFLRILQRAAPDDPSRARWQEQLLAVSLEMATLVRGLQARAHASDAPDQLQACWLPDSAIHRLAAEALRHGAEVDSLELQRMIGLLAQFAGLDETTLGPACSVGHLPDLAGAGESLFGLLTEPASAVAISFAGSTGEDTIHALRASADVILPTGSVDPQAWRCALLAALLRNCTSDVVIEHRPDHPVRLHLLLPRGLSA